MNIDEIGQKFSMFSVLKSSLLFLLSVVLLSSCSGGGSSDDGDFIGAAEVSLTASPKIIDTGDRTEVRIRIQHVNESGIALKIRFPSSLSYVPSSAQRIVDGDEHDASPTVNATKDDDVYLVFYFSQDDFDSDASGQVIVLLEGVSSEAEGFIEVDADVDDPAIDNSSEFSLEEPEFEAESDSKIQVEG